MCRELQEESGLLVKSSNLIKFAVIEFEFVGDPVILEVHAFQTHSFEGEPIETEGKQFPNMNSFYVTELIWMSSQKCYRNGTSFMKFLSIKCGLMTRSGFLCFSLERHLEVISCFRVILTF